MNTAACLFVRTVNDKEQVDVVSLNSQSQGHGEGVDMGVYDVIAKVGQNI